MKRYPYAKQAEAMTSKLGDGVWRSLEQIERELGYRWAQTACSARIRDLRRGVPGFEQWSAQRYFEMEGKKVKNWYRIVRRPHPVSVRAEQQRLFA